jgi:hypothetical protein
MWQHTPEPLKKKKKLFSVSFRRNIFPNFFYNRMNIFRKLCHLLTIFLPKRNDWFKPGTVELTCHSSIKWTILRMWDQMKTTFSIYKGSLPYGKFKCSNQATVENSHFTLTIGEHSSKCETRLELIVPYSLPYRVPQNWGPKKNLLH